MRTRAFFLLTLAASNAAAIETCADLQKLYISKSITEGGDGCCGHPDAALKIPECNAVKDFVQPIATQGLPIDLPDNALVKAAMERLPTSTGIASALADYTDAYFSHPFGAALSQYVKTCRYWAYFRETPPALFGSLTFEKGDAVPSFIQYNEHSAMSLQRMTPDPVTKTILLNAVNEYNQDIWGNKAVSITKSWYRPGWALLANGSWIEEPGVNTWIYYFDSPITQSRWQNAPTLPTGGFFGAENRGATYVLETFDAATMKPIPERCTFVCMVSKLQILPDTYSGALAEGGIADLFSKDRYTNDLGLTMYSVQDFYSSVRNLTWTPTDGFGAFDDTQLGALNIVLIQAGCKYMNPSEALALPKQLLTTPGEDDVPVLGSNKGTGIVRSFESIRALPLIAPSAYTLTSWFKEFPPGTYITSTYDGGWAVDLLPSYAGFENYNSTYLADLASQLAREMNKDPCMTELKSQFFGQTLSFAFTSYGKMHVEATEFVWKDDVENLFPNVTSLLPANVRAAKKGDHFAYTDDVFVTEVVDSSTPQGSYTATQLLYADHSNMYSDPFDPYPNSEKAYGVKYMCKSTDQGVTLHRLSVLDDYSCFHSKDAPSPWDVGTKTTTHNGVRRQYTKWKTHNDAAISSCNTALYSHEYFQRIGDVLKADVTKYTIDAITEDIETGWITSFRAAQVPYFEQKIKFTEVEIAPTAIQKELTAFAKIVP